jgi:hypothetical protein
MKILGLFPEKLTRRERGVHVSSCGFHVSLPEP